MGKGAEHLSNLPDDDLLAGYREMANDQEHEVEAREWCEGLIGDATNSAPPRHPVLRSSLPS